VEVGKKLTSKDGKSRHVGERLSSDVLIYPYSTACVLPIARSVMSNRVIGQSQQATKPLREIWIRHQTRVQLLWSNPSEQFAKEL